jgi:hypothetical protein
VDQRLCAARISVKGLAMTSPNEAYWSRRAFVETKTAIQCDDPHIAAIHVDLATRCVRQFLQERERGQGKTG